MNCGEFLFLKNVKMAIEKQIDKRMWVIFKLDIEKNAKIEIMNDLPELIDNKIFFINKILKKLTEVFLLIFFLKFIIKPIKS